MKRLSMLPVIFCFLLASARLHAVDASRLIQFTAPTGGEVYVVGQMQNVQIHSSLKVLTIELSRDGGLTFVTLGTLDNRRTHGLFAWTVTAGATTNGIFRASAVKGGQTISVTSSAFSIDAGTAIGGAPITTAGLADGSVTNPKLAEQAVTANKISSGAASSNFILAADGNGSALWEPILGLLPTVGAPYVLKTGDTMTGGLQIAAATTGLTVSNDAANQSTVAVGPNAPTNGSLSIGATQNSFNISVRDSNPNLLLSDSGTGNSAGFVQFRESDQVTVRGQLAAFSATHTSKANWLSLSNFTAGPIVFSTSNTEAMRVINGTVGIATTAPNSTLHVAGSLATQIRSSAVSATLLTTDYTLVMTGAGTTPTLPSAVNIAGRIYVIKNRSSGAITPATTAGQTIDGAAPASLATNALLTVQSDGANWVKLN